ncbi:DUF2807 domain-containing protein [Antarcticibacterium sp. 1MA-6-2]|uniref:head GIN domain-containing protein n=1 Tax=Antarcticibacterium sp. 1MA-6-2 TaxID=2908210 RepID=UPI001F313FAA|nr:head GIN domain-containing protein [Antarcticibacterium sp. 1MA-6-2]UJH90202.1 DUF2807 domain-containing protein [Antarcticibacterium sp. 1MA-6-2]
MKKLLFLLLFIPATGVFGQEINIDLDNFNEVEVSRGLTVNFTPAEENTAVITGNSRDKINLKVDKGVLIIKTSLTQLLKSDNTVVNVYYKQLQDIKARQNAAVEFCSKISQPLIKFKATEGAEIIAFIEVENLVANASTGGNLRIRGKAEKQEIDVNAAGGFRGENLKGENIRINLNGGGSVYVFAENYVDATVRAGGHVYIYGDPERVDEHTSFGGVIKKIN